MLVTRRDFLRGVGTLTACAAASGPLAALPEAGSAQGGRRSAEEIVKTTCGHCVNFCGIEVHKVGGVIRSILPDPARRAYYNHGLCPKGVAGGFTAYDPYRVTVPLRRRNPKKGLDVDPQWLAISWEEAFSILAERLAKIRRDDPAKLVWHQGQGEYLIGDPFPKAFCQAFGTPNLIHRASTCQSARQVAEELTWGHHGSLPDIDHCNLLVVFGSNYLEAGQSARWMDHAITRARERGMKIVAVEPRFSHVAAKADQWIPVRPGKDVVILLAIARHLIETGQIDGEFLVNCTNAPQLVGADGKLLHDAAGESLVWDRVTRAATAYRPGVEPALRGAYAVDGVSARPALEVFAASLAELSLREAAAISGVAAETISELAEAIAREARLGATSVIGGVSRRYRPVAIHASRGLTAREYGVQSWRAGLLLQMLLGNLDALGGLHPHDVYRQPAHFDPARCEYPPRRADLAESVYFPNARHDVCQQVALSVLDPEAYGLPYQPEMQIFYATNRPVSTSDTATQLRALEKTFNLAIEVHMSETAWMADIVLPDLNYLEAWQLSPTRRTPRTTHTAIRRPVVNVYDLPHDAFSILWELAKRLGLRDDYIRGINEAWQLEEHRFATGRDYTAREAVEILWAEKTRGKPFEVALAQGFVGETLTAETVYGQGVEARFTGPGRPKLKFYADQMVHTMERVRQVVAAHAIANIDIGEYQRAYSPLPRKAHAFPVPHRLAEDLPFYLITYKRMYRNQTACSNTNPILNQALGPDVDDNQVLMNTGAGRELGLRDGARVVVETRIARVIGKVRFTEGIRPDTVAVSYHYGQASQGFPTFARKGIAVNRVLELHPDKVSGMNSFNDTKCKVYRV
jgi:molybdopterin-containing oxidoreductase family molybdopterin binding subunit